MSFRFICPHCRVAVDPAAMEVSFGQWAEFRVCPCCDSPVVLAVRGGQEAERIAPGAGSVKSLLEPGSDCASRHNPQQTPA